MPKQRLFFCLLLAVFLSLPSSGFANKKKKDKVVGAIWSYRATKVEEGDEKPEEIFGHFRVVNYVIFSGKKKVGKVIPVRDFESKITISEWPEMNGTMTVKRTDNKPVKWTGEFIKSDASKWSVTLKVTVK